MKKILLLLLMVSLAFLSCQKDDEKVGGKVGGEVEETNVLIGEWKIPDPDNDLSTCSSKSLWKFTKSSITKKDFTRSNTIGGEIVMRNLLQLLILLMVTK